MAKPRGHGADLTLFSKEVLPRLEGLTEASETPVRGFSAVAKA